MQQILLGMMLISHLPQGIFIFMYGTSKKFAHLEISRFAFPEILNLEECGLKKECDFIEFLIRNDWVQKILGIKMSPSNGLFPDIKGEIYDGSGDKIKVEVEYSAHNYILHRHPFGGCDLIISFLRKREVRFIKGIPVWSFYMLPNTGKLCPLCLYSDINTDFDDIQYEEEYTTMGIADYGIIRNSCSSCGSPTLTGRLLCAKCASRIGLKIHS